jgi:NADH dehydrogenase
MILITGATSFVGRTVVRALADEQNDVRCLLRPSRHEQQLPQGISSAIVSASMDDLPALRTAMQDVRAIIHLAGEEDLDRQGTLHNHLQDTANLIAAAHEAGVRRLVYLSRLGANQASAYPLFRARGEVEVAVQQCGLDYTILRAPVIYGPEDTSVNVLIMLAKFMPFFFPIPDTGQTSFQPLWVGDLARCILATPEQDNLIGQTVPLGGPEHFNFEQMVRTALAAAGINRRLVKVRMPIIHWLIAVADALLPRNPTPLWWLDLVTLGGTTDLLTIPRHFDFEPSRFSVRLSYLRNRRPWRRDFFRLISRRPG